ncbi:MULTISPECIES: hypothetical protein [Methylomonas]|uniref:Uncharacterized protein n=2 Tax=Methylomonas TaxID=416 RepID=A0A126T3I3_9GAMM|nr:MULTISPECIES: hypothetical protein [Methylomonas]AMK76656.1 hypothetical protein JT25_009165 [Methylomonas denitrificans]OAH97238.1 hypothetical protein A1342_19010 [Methylomonas methanica]TCV82853.1 hypothetical protein EDE11_111109 [Methylomonas methanica]
MEKFVFGVGEDDRKRLLNFVDTLQRFLEQVVDNGEYFQPKFRDDYKKAWNELNPHFSALKDALQRADTHTLLAQGLLGTQLNLKLAVVNHFLNEFLLYGIEIIGGHKLLEKLLRIVSKLLANMASTVGTGLAIQSYTDFLVAMIKDDG